MIRYGALRYFYSAKRKEKIYAEVMLLSIFSNPRESIHTSLFWFFLISSSVFTISHRTKKNQKIIIFKPITVIIIGRYQTFSIPVVAKLLSFPLHAFLFSVNFFFYLISLRDPLLFYFCLPTISIFSRCPIYIFYYT